VDLYCVATEETKARLVARAVPGERVAVTGIPVGAAFSTEALDKASIRRRFGLRDDLPTIPDCCAESLDDIQLTCISSSRRTVMQVAKWGNSLAVRLPSAVVEALDLKEGDQIEIRIVGDRTFEVQRDRSRQDALARLRQLRRPLPAGFVFDRNEANAR
jgi:antitoxin MazE